MMSKEMWIAEFDRMVGDYMDEHDCDWTTAYEAIGERGDEVTAATRERFADMCDMAMNRDAEIDTGKDTGNDR